MNIFTADKATKAFMRGVPGGVSINMLLGLKVEGGPGRGGQMEPVGVTFLCP